jgi:hypothetical protein
MKVIPVTYLMKVIPGTYVMKVIPVTRRGGDDADISFVLSLVGII